MNAPRPLSSRDLDAIDRLHPDDWPPYRHTFERYFSSSCCQTWGYEDTEGPTAMGSLISFGTTGWLAQIITAPRSQRQGLATKVVSFLVNAAARQGITTLSLVATDQGFPVYERAGFRVEGEYTFWVREAGPAPGEPLASPVRVCSPDDHAAILTLDKQVSGENREAYLGRDLPQAWVVPGQGYFLPTLGEGLVVANTVSAGIALLHRRIDGAARVVVPTENKAAVAVLESQGFRPAKVARRMVLGPSVRRHPEWVWSRIGGNLG